MTSAGIERKATGMCDYKVTVLPPPPFVDFVNICIPKIFLSMFL